MRPPAGLAAALFDLDGTLVDREPLMTASLQSVMADLGHPLDDAAAAATIGRSWVDVHHELVEQKDIGVDLAVWHRQILFAAAALTAGGFPVRVLTGGVELIGAFAAAGLAVGIVTGSTRVELDEAVARLGITALLATTVAAEDYPVGKPAPEPYLVGAARLGVAPHEVVAFEDSDPGVASARAAGTVVVATAEANPPAGAAGHQQLVGADVVVRDLAAVDESALAAAVAAATDDARGPEWAATAS